MTKLAVKLAVKLSGDPSPLYADEFEKFMKSFHGSKVVGVTGRRAKPNSSDRYSPRDRYYVKRDDGLHRVEFHYCYGIQYGYGWRGRSNYKGWRMHKSKASVQHGRRRLHSSE